MIEIRCMYVHAHVQISLVDGNFFYLSRSDECLWHSPIPSARAGGNEVSDPTALQQCVHILTTKVKTNEVPHLQQTDANHSSLRTSSVTACVREGGGRERERERERDWKVHRYLVKVVTHPAWCHSKRLIQQCYSILTLIHHRSQQPQQQCSKTIRKQQERQIIRTGL